MIYKDEKLTIDTDKVIGITLAGNLMILMLEDYTQSVEYENAEDALNAYKTIQESIAKAREEKLEKIYETNNTL